MSEILRHLNTAFNPLKVSFEIVGTKIRAKGSSYDQRERLKKLGFLFNSLDKVWEIEGEKFSLEDIALAFPKPFTDPTMIKQRLLDYITQVKTPILQELLNRLLTNGEYKESFFLSSAAKSIHHAYESGLAEHTLQVLTSALQMMEIYPYISVNRDILITGALLHDIGKVKCYQTTSEGIEITPYLEQFDHVILGVSLVSEASAGLIHSEPDRQIINHLLQIITSHHNLPEWGSPKSPTSPEAWIIHTMDQLSSKIGGGYRSKVSIKEDN